MLTHYKFCKHKNINPDKEQVLPVSSDNRYIPNEMDDTIR